MESITSPADIDILCGKDKTFNKHPGNLLYRQLIEEHAQGYTNECSKQIKMKVTKDIVGQMERSGARFIRKVGNECWKEISNQEARDKTSHALRYCAGSQGKQPAVAATTYHNNNNITMSTPIRRVNTRAVKAKREHRRIVSLDYNSTDHPFSNRIMAPLFDGGLHEHSFVSSLGSSSSMTLLEASTASLPDFCLSLHPSISLSSVDDVDDAYDNEEASNDYHHHHDQDHDEEYGHYDTSSVNDETYTFLPDQVASSYYYSTTTTAHPTARDDADIGDDLEQILQEPLGVVSRDDIWDDDQFCRQSS
jgi:hypothetical protein